MPHVSRLAITPVKGLGLLHPDSVELGPGGVAENRRLYLIDETGRLFSGIRHGPLVRIRPAYDDASGRLTLRFPDGSVVDGETALGEPVVTDFFGRRVTGRLVEGPWAARISLEAGTTLRLVRADEPGGACDVHPVSLLADASVEELAEQAGRDAVDGRRFRMLIGIGGTAPHAEDAWDGTAVAIGEALVRVLGPVGRCATTTRDPDTGLRDFDALRAITAYRGVREGRVDFGVYAVVERPGRVRVGDAVDVVEAAPAPESRPPVEAEA